MERYNPVYAPRVGVGVTPESIVSIGPIYTMKRLAHRPTKHLSVSRSPSIPRLLVKSVPRFNGGGCVSLGVYKTAMTKHVKRAFSIALTGKPSVRDTTQNTPNIPMVAHLI